MEDPSLIYFILFCFVMQGTLVRYEMRVYGIGPATLHKDELANCRPHSNNFYLVSLPPVVTILAGFSSFVFNIIGVFILILYPLNLSRSRLPIRVVH